MELDDVRRAVGAADPGDGRRPWASVLCLLVETDHGLSIVLERRPQGPRPFGGHLSFPGGKVETADTDALHAALRETHEEIGVPPDDVEVLGLLCETRDPRGHAVTCFVGRMDGRPPPEPASPDEVEETMLVALDTLREPGVHAADHHVYVAESYESRLWPADERLVQYWPLRSATGTGTLWGFTAGLVSVLLNQAVGWHPPSPPTVVTRWEDLLPEPPVAP